MKINPNIIITLFVLGCCTAGKQAELPMSAQNKVSKTDNEWKAMLTPEQYNICRLKATELPGSGKYYNFYQKGYYKCVACGNRLFNSDTKYDSGSGWPSFFDVHDKNYLILQTDSSHGMTRTEITCAGCGSHLGHVFDDGPRPTGTRYCINSLALEFVAENKNDQ